ncbi:MAG: NAD-dependent epimerase, partial [bacterium]|nr:NAD-dependent epimerase [bacterium]
VLALDNGGAGSTYVASSGEYRPLKEVAEAAAKATGAVAESWPIEEARAELGDAADGLAMNQQIVARRASDLLGWKHDSPGVLEEIARAGAQ